MADDNTVSTDIWQDRELGVRLLEKGLISEESLATAREQGAENGRTLAESIVALGLAPKRTVYEELASVYGVPFVDLNSYEWDRSALAMVGEGLLRELDVFPLFAIGETLTVAFVDPGNISAIDRVSLACGCTVEVCLAARDDLRDAVARAFGGDGRVRELLDRIEESGMRVSPEASGQVPAAGGLESPVSRLVDLIIAQAVKDAASDIHLDLHEEGMYVKFRVDGMLYDIPAPPRHLFPFIVSRIKVMSSMDIAESRIPQDGSFRTAVDGRSIECRVSSVPTIFGEKIAIRILDMQTMSISLEDLGMSDGLLGDVEKLLRRPFGMFAVTGPTGSGKSTTLYAMLSKVRSPSRHVITIEDPVERHMKMVSQIQVNDRAGLTFVSALRSILRQDPDVIMVGEIRDQETAQLAIRAALTGHLVFSTLHTNDACSAATRLIDMGVEPFLVAASLVGTLGQRLVRRICGECREAHELPPEILTRMQASGIELPKEVWAGAGCAKCRNTGYKGRLAIFELARFTPALAELVASNAPLARLKEQAREDGMADMLHDGIGKVIDGRTTIEEVLKTTQLETIQGDGFEDVVIPDAPAEEEASSAEADAASGGPPAASGLNIDDYTKEMANWLAKRDR